MLSMSPHLCAHLNHHHLRCFPSLLAVYRDNRDRRVAREKKFSEEWDKAVEFLISKGIVKAPPVPLRPPSAPSSSSSSSSADGDVAKGSKGGDGAQQTDSVNTGGIVPSAATGIIPHARPHAL